MKKITALLDDAARAMREGAGVVVDSTIPAFNVPHVKKWFKFLPNDYTYETIQPPDKIYVTVDPDAGGESTSSCAVVSGYRTKPNNLACAPMTFVIIGLESRSTKSHLDQQLLVISHIKRLRSNPLYQNVPIVFIPEIGTGFQHTHLHQAVNENHACYTLHEKMGSIPGVRKDDYMTKSYTMATFDIIENLGFVLDKHWLTVFGHKNNKQMLLTEFQEQLTRYGYDDKQKLTGKFGGRFKDDLTIAFMMAVYWSRVLEQPFGSNPYREFIQGLKQHQELIRTHNLKIDTLQNMQINSSILPREIDPESKRGKEMKAKAAQRNTEEPARGRVFSGSKRGFDAFNATNLEVDDD